MTVTAIQIRLRSHKHAHVHTTQSTALILILTQGVDGKCGPITSGQCVIHTDEKDHRNSLFLLPNSNKQGL